jgi:alpha-1,4-digalacturonate transport system permease protein
MSIDTAQKSYVPNPSGGLSRRIRDLPGAIGYQIYGFVMNSIDLVLATPAQRILKTNHRMGYFFVLPNLIIFGTFVLFPMLLNFYFAFTGGTQLFPRDRPFVGLQNFETLFRCQNMLDPNTCVEDRFWRGILNTIGFVVFQVGGMVFFSLVTALILNRNIWGRGFFRSVFFYPVLLSPVVVALIWKWILQREGVLNAIITSLGGQQSPFLLQATWAQFWVIAISIWAQMGFFTLILLAGLQAIPTELYEAGAIDGTSRWQAFQFITMPLLMPTMLVVTVLSLIRAVQVFDQVFVLTGGGPGTATQYILQYIYDVAFAAQVPRQGLASAASIILGAALLIFTLVQLRLGRSSNAA